MNTDFPFIDDTSKMGPKQLALYEHYKDCIRTHHSWGPEAIKWMRDDPQDFDWREKLAESINKALSSCVRVNPEDIDRIDNPPRSNQPKVNIRDFLEGKE